jgi:hypothetical protein
MKHLNPGKLKVRYMEGVQTQDPEFPRKYTLTHSDLTGELFLSIGPTFDLKEISGIYTRLMRDEVLASWELDPEGPSLHIHCHVSGGLVVGPAGWRDAIFQRHLPLVLEAFRYGDQAFFERHPARDRAPLLVHFHSTRSRYNRIEDWGTPRDYR